MGSITAQRGGTGGASKALSNLANVAINTTLMPASDMASDLGTALKRWNNFCPATLRTGEAAADSILFQARDVDGASWTTFATLLANNAPTWVFNENVNFVDSKALELGTGSDSRLYYDGIDTFWDLRATGTGDLMIALGAGFPSPDPNAVHIWKGSAGAVAAGSDRQLIIENNGSVGIALLGTNTTTARLSFGDPESDNAGQLSYKHTDDTMRVRIADVQQLIWSAGAFALQGAHTISTSAGDLTLVPDGKLDARGTPGASVGGFASGQFHVTNPSTDVNANSVITGHNLNGGNKQLWYLGSTSSSNDAVAFINRQNSDMFFSTNNIERMRIEPGGSVAIGVSSALGQLHLSQPSGTGAQPVLYLEQEDVSEEMIEFDSTIGVGNAIEAVGAKTLTTTHFIKVTLPGGLTRYLPVGTIA